MKDQVAGMFSKILGGVKNPINDSKKEKLHEKISKMDLADMRLYVNGKLHEYEVSEFGLVEILKRLTLINDTTSSYYMKDDDMDSKKKKIFDLVILILKNKKINISGLEMVERFLETYNKVIKNYDKDNSDIYEKKIKDSIKKAITMIELKSDIVDKMRTLK